MRVCEEQSAELKEGRLRCGFRFRACLAPILSSMPPASTPFPTSFECLPLPFRPRFAPRSVDSITSRCSLPSFVALIINSPSFIAQNASLCTLLASKPTPYPPSHLCQFHCLRYQRSISVIPVRNTTSREHSRPPLVLTFRRNVPRCLVALSERPGAMTA